MLSQRTCTHLSAALAALALLRADLVLAATTAQVARGGTLPEFARELAGIPVFGSTGPIPRAWYGGLQSPRPQLLDIDGDDDLDLFVAEDSGKLRFYRNDGTSSSPSFLFQTDDYASVHELYFTRFRDVDADLDFDLLVEAPPFVTIIGGEEIEQTGAFLYTNTGSPSAPAYVNLSTHPEGYLADELGDPIPFVTTAPDFVDLEGDGDADLLLGDPSGSLWLYRNVGSPSSPSFRFETDQYNNILIVFGSCERAAYGLEEVPRAHGFMLLDFFDFDGDALPDLFVGDQFNSNVYHYRNMGGAPSPDFSCATEFFFPGPGGGPGFFSQYLLPAFGDLDGDQDPDVILGSGISATEGLYFYRHNGSSLSLESENYLPELDLGRESTPAFADLDGDGDEDLFVGSTSGQSIALYENIGSASNPEFAILSPAWLPLPNSAWAAPEFADLDGDLDLDLFVGMTSGAVRFFRNDSPGSWPPSFIEITTDAAFGDFASRTIRQNVDSQAVPRFFDGDGDGDLDLLLGNWDFSGEARLLLFRNDGSSTAHAFVLASTDYQNLGALGQQLAPFWVDLDLDDDSDLIVGNRAGELVFIRNVGSATTPNLQVEDMHSYGIDVGQGAVPWFVDVDGDFDLDLVLGENGGGLNFYRNLESPCLPPEPFSLASPPAGVSLDAGTAVLFDWAASLDPQSGSEARYELRLTPRTELPESEWTVFPELTASEKSVVPAQVGLRFSKAFFWSVAAKSECGGTQVSEWRQVFNSAFPAEEATFEDTRVRIIGSSPNPSSAEVAITYVVLKSISRDERIHLAVYDLAGRAVAVLRDEETGPGNHTSVWNGRTSRGTPAAPGIYFVRAELAGDADTGRLVIVR